MATIKPFAALRPQPELAGRICELPYDVMSSEEARQVAAGNPLSFLHVSKPEIDLPPGTGPYSPEVYAKGRENFQKLIRDGALRQDARPCFYLYRQIMGRHSQIGLVAAASCEEYLRRHHQEARTDAAGQGGRPRAPHRSAQLANRAGVPDLSRHGGASMRSSRRESPEQPDVDFTATDGVRHTSWVDQRRGGIQVHRRRSSPGFRSSTSRTAIIAAPPRRGFFRAAKARATAADSSP